MPLKLIEPRPGRTPYWYIRGTIYGRIVDASTKARDKKAAQRFKDQFELKLAKADGEKHAPATFRIAAQMYKNYRKPRKSDGIWIDRLVTVIGDCVLSDIRQHTLVDAANELYPDSQPGTKNRQALVPASSILHYAAENNLCPYVRVKKFKEKTPEGRALGKDDAKALMAGAEGELRVLLVWLFHQGWRIGDTLRLSWEDINLKEGTARYHVSKIDDWRLMPLHEKTVASLRTLGADLAGKVFHWSDKSNLYRDLRPLCKRLGIYFTPHMARHSFATWLANEGVSPLELMEAGGWKDHKSVIRYAKLDPTRVRAIIGKIV